MDGLAIAFIQVEGDSLAWADIGIGFDATGLLCAGYLLSFFL
jgi:hypothetical protein